MPGNNICSVRKQRIQFAAHKKLIGKVSQPAKGNAVVDNIRHLHATGNSFEMVLVMPEAVGPVALFIYKKTVFLHMGDLRHPIYFNAQHRFQGVFDDLAGIDPIAMGFTFNGEAHVFRRNML